MTRPQPKRRLTPEELADIRAITAAGLDGDRRVLEAHGACRSIAPEVFFPQGMDDAEGGYFTRNAIRERIPKDICGGCPVRLECLTYSITDPDARHSDGVWGGYNTDERKRIWNRIKAMRRAS